MGKEMSKILPGLYVGRLVNVQDDSDMMANCITHVLSVHEPVKQKLIKSNSYTYLEINVKDDDTASISKYFSKTNDFIHGARMSGGNVLIHCLAGVSRAPTIVIAYLMTVYDLTFQDSFDYFRTIRPSIMPNNGFIRQLTLYEGADKLLEKERLFNQFGTWKNIEEDKNHIKEFINGSNKDKSHYINELNDFGPNDGLSSPLTSSFDGVPGFFNDDGIDKAVDVIDLDMLEENSFGLKPFNDREDGISDEGEEIDIPGSIPIGGSISKDCIGPFGNSTSDFRGRAHSRGQMSTNNNQIHSVNTYGSTAPSEVSIFQRN